MRKQVVYIWRDPASNFPIYVGRGFEERPFAHLSNKCKTRLGHTLRKRRAQGFVVKPEIHAAASMDDANEMEMLLIDMIGRECLGTGTLFNITDGGGGTQGYKHTAEARAQITAANIGTQKAKGTVFSAEARARLAEKGRGRYYSPETRAKISAATQGNQNRLGMKTSEETKAKQSAVKLGKICTPEHCASLKEANNRRVSCLTCRKETTVPSLGKHKACFQ